MSRNKYPLIAVSVFIIVTLAACNLAGVLGGVSQPSQEPTSYFETQVAGAIASTFAAQTTVANTLASTQAAMATPTLEFTFTPSLSPTATLTSTPSVPMVSVSTATNCRSGPTTAYDLLGVLNLGETAEVVGLSTYSDTMIIKLPSNPRITCWLWAQHATVAGNTSGLPLINVPPTPTPKFSPTPALSFNVVYSSTITCSGKYMLKFKITNTGSITLESNNIKATNQVTSEEHTTSYNDFPNENNGCSLANDDQNLEAGEIGYTTSSGFSGNPAGDSFKATITVCSLNGMNGTCLDKTITFTP